MLLKIVRVKIKMAIFGSWNKLMMFCIFQVPCLGPMELESVLVSHSTLAKVLVVGVPHKTKGEDIHAFVTFEDNCSAND
ncbi:AMP-binding enzyme [cyanobacterium endosymbiont of Rhopalodia gibberula]|uniref:AMP-binding enzyme n=1 Tax=cyanobacterium endosymbiont of Rhopalodia gibberula TaxID=1763363 RepID=UPI000E65D6D4|nr:hypothetical protein [cyanobacterium endosymbiont of Rhopalodia gibberula]